MVLEGSYEDEPVEERVRRLLRGLLEKAHPEGVFGALRLVPRLLHAGRAALLLDPLLESVSVRGGRLGEPSLVCRYVEVVFALGVLEEGIDQGLSQPAHHLAQRLFRGRIE
jgi:hypothetical protein